MIIPGDMMNEDTKKKVDQNWKNQVEKEKGEAKSKNEAYHQPTFEIFISSLTMQAMIALGKLENPLTKRSDKNYDQARFLIDTLEILKEKTKNNLHGDEEKLLDESLFNLRMMYVEDKKV
jgi:hypothetical protein